MRFISAVIAGLTVLTVAQGALADDTYVDLLNKRHTIAKKPATYYGMMACDAYMLRRLKDRPSSTEHVRQEASEHYSELMESLKPIAERAFVAKYAHGSPAAATLGGLQANVRNLTKNVIAEMNQKHLSLENLSDFRDVCYHDAQAMGRGYGEK